MTDIGNNIKGSQTHYKLGIYVCEASLCKCSFFVFPFYYWGVASATLKHS